MIKIEISAVIHENKIPIWSSYFIRSYEIFSPYNSEATGEAV